METISFPFFLSTKEFLPSASLPRVDTLRYGETRSYDCKKHHKWKLFHFHFFFPRRVSSIRVFATRRYASIWRDTQLRLEKTPEMETVSCPFGVGIKTTTTANEKNDVKRFCLLVQEHIDLRTESNMSALSFADLVVSTKTVVVSSNLEVDVAAISDRFLPGLADAESVGRPMEAGGLRFRLGDVYYKKSFRNALNVVYQLEETEVTGGAVRRVNMKVHKNGKFQLTGCKKMVYAQTCLWHFIQSVHLLLPKALNVSPAEPASSVRLYFQTVMTNVDFNLGFMVNRQELDMLMNKTTHYYSLLETSFGYTGVNIKFPLTMKWWQTPCPAMQFQLCKDFSADDYALVSHSLVPLKDFVAAEAIERLQRKGKFNTFLVFHSGKVIMSGMFSSTMQEDYEMFMSIIRKWKPLIEQKTLPSAHAK